MACHHFAVPRVPMFRHVSISFGHLRLKFSSNPFLVLLFGLLALLFWSRFFFQSRSKITHFANLAPDPFFFDIIQNTRDAGHVMLFYVTTWWHRGLYYRMINTGRRVNPPCS